MGKLAKDVKAAVMAGDLTKQEAKSIMESAEPSGPWDESQPRRTEHEAECDAPSQCGRRGVRGIP